MIGAVVLAAGASRRFGPAPKMLAPLNGRPLLAHALAPLAAAGVRCVVVVTGPSRARVVRVARAQAGPAMRLRFVHNPDYRHGMAGSLQRGLRGLPGGCDAALICLGDMPAVDAGLIQRLRARWHAGLDCLRPVHNGVVGHPVLLSRRLFAHIEQLRGDRGARAVFDRIPAARQALIPAGADSIIDIDTPAALRAYGRRRCRTAAAARYSDRICDGTQRSVML